MDGHVKKMMLNFGIEGQKLKIHLWRMSVLELVGGH